jgi:hypothetical protein
MTLVRGVGFKAGPEKHHREDISEQCGPMLGRLHGEYTLVTGHHTEICVRALPAYRLRK